MKHISHKNIFLLSGTILASFFLWLSSETVAAAQTINRGAPPHQSKQTIHRGAPPHQQPTAIKHKAPPRHFNDQRYLHNRSYPSRGQYVRALPRDHRVVVHGSTRFYFHGGVWYRPSGTRFIIAAPPIGLFVPFLPPYYATIWLGGIPYYYANDVYYAHRGDGYVVVEPPKEEVSQAPPPADKMFIYPRLDQSEQQQADDRFACHRWAAEQTGFDPTQPPDSTPESIKSEKRADYQRAMAACLDGRGYTVR